MSGDGATIRAVIVDDEPLARERLRRLLAREAGVRIVAECANGRRAVEAIVARRPDLVFLDVQMPGMDGFGVLRELRAELEAGGLGSAALPLVVFVTAHDEHALQAFDVHAIDYVLKPIEGDRLASAVARVRARQSQAGAARRLRELQRLIEIGAEPARTPAPESVADPTPLRPEGRWLSRIVVRSQEKLLFVRVEEIDWVEAAGNYVKLHVGERTHLVRDTLSRLETALDPAIFARIHRSTIVNVDRVRHMEPWFSGEYLVVLHDGTQLKLSRSYRDRVIGRFTPAADAAGPAERAEP